ncbi:hypothetical protein TSUD_149160 [Trifolium subterraneum]|uniref:DUF223 domain-containing protein n=1 Tax=Trifolium subterraneum TaxID=3900 RepID=A0A2Z6MMC9_TRISU|nr:hypothetical protein TSUD_149160 [Trifolium subterraneum]
MGKVCKKFDDLADILPNKEAIRIKVVCFVYGSGYYRTTLHPYKLIFQLKTKIQVVINSAISNYGPSLTNLAEVCAHQHDYEYLVDVGLLTGISVEREYIREGKIIKMIIIEFTDASGKCECALFGHYVDELNKKMGKENEGLPVVIQFAKVKIFRDKTLIQNVINTTRIFVNPDIPEAEALKKGFVADSDFSKCTESSK